MSDGPQQQEQVPQEGYEPPTVERIEVVDEPAVVAAGLQST